MIHLGGLSIIISIRNLISEKMISFSHFSSYKYTTVWHNENYPIFNVFCFLQNEEKEKRFTDKYGIINIARYFFLLIQLFETFYEIRITGLPSVFDVFFFERRSPKNSKTFLYIVSVNFR